MKKSKNKEDLSMNLKVSTITKYMTLFGVVGIIISVFIPDDESWKSIIKGISNSLSGTLFSAGMVSVIVEISTIKNLVHTAFKNILSGDFELDGLSMDALINLKNQVAKKILNTTRDLKNSPYKYEDMLLNSVNEKYYEHHNITYHITPDEKNNCFHIKTKIDYRIINKQLIDNFFEVRLKLYKIDKESDNTLSNKFSVSYIKVNNKDIDIEDVLKVEPIIHHGESTYYDYKVRIYKELEGTKNNVKAELTYDVPMFDICQSFKISAPCKNIEHKFYIENDVSTQEEWIIQANAYSTFFHRQDNDESNYKVEQNIDSSLIIKYSDWALVGNGYCVFYQKKH